MRELHYKCTPEQWLSGEYPDNNVYEEAFEEARRDGLIATLAEEQDGEELFFAQRILRKKTNDNKQN